MFISHFYATFKLPMMKGVAASETYSIVSLEREHSTKHSARENVLSYGYDKLIQEKIKSIAISYTICSSE